MKQYPINLNFENEYGSLIVEPVSEIMPVKDIRCKNYDESIKFDLDTAEKITLITENRRCQIAFSKWAETGNYGMLLIHTSTSTAMVVKIKTLDYKGPESAAGEIERLAPITIGPIPLN